LAGQYIVTESIPDIPKNLPTMRDPDNLVYYKPEVGGLVMGDMNLIQCLGRLRGYQGSLAKNFWNLILITLNNL